MLAKSQTDPEKIEEAIARLIQQHNDDEEAHLGPGQSLHSHKAAEIIDHLAKSVVADKLAKFSVAFTNFFADRTFFMSGFESLDNWIKDIVGAGSIQAGILGVYLTTGSVSGNYCELSSAAPGAIAAYTYNKELFFQTSIAPVDTTDQQIFITHGNPNAENRYIGFKIVGNQMFAVSRNYGAEKAVSLLTFGFDEAFVLRVEHRPEEGKAEFYVNQILKATFTDTLPTGFTEFGPAYIIKTLANVSKRLKLFDVMISNQKEFPT